MASMKIKVHNISEDKGDVDLDAMMSEFKQVLGNDYKLRGYTQNTKYEQQLVIEVKGVGEFFCGYALVYNGGSFKVRTWDADTNFDLDCDMSLFKKLQTIFYKYCGG